MTGDHDPVGDGKPWGIPAGTCGPDGRHPIPDRDGPSSCACGTVSRRPAKPTRGPA